MPTRRQFAALAGAALLAGCGYMRTESDGRTITYWASNQGSSLEFDKQTLQPELAKFEQRTGIRVRLEVVPWSDLLNRLLAAATSGKGPDVVNIGNTWSASLQATNALVSFDDAAMAKIGGRDRFVPAALAAAGAPGKPPTAVPLYSLSYALYYNKQMFADAGVERPPATWEDLVAVGKRLTRDKQWGLAIEGANPSENAHHAFTFSQQYGGEWFDDSGKPTFDTAANVKAIKRYVDLMAVDKIVNPSNAEYAKNESQSDFANRKAAMLLWQAAGSAFRAQGMSPEEYGVAPVPFLAQPPAGSRKVNSMVAGINIAVFRRSQNLDGAMQFVKFMTSDEEQVILNGTYGSLPSVKAAAADPAFQAPEQKVLSEVLNATAAPLPQVPAESQFETLVGSTMKELFAAAANDKPVTEDIVRSRLRAAEQRMRG
ncbi:sugar ABC transporter substrate-binding protein [Dactylosporangium sp. AC04546]|uniref:ABC transporter substrate-binding protein n=1 Tax=Dactylosporangium sp. AC04546 TaxID=2862460 RepID=UPI001EE135E1|nr:sugar ABC transporter substrate-binding protein [Dactylosporangium sp. AC04546]WVK82050.1 sugar ABC transporter substrate-binding protein [Dactylosporangium sp. AC04546]